MPGGQPASVVVFRNGDVVAPCAIPEWNLAYPSPCVAYRLALAGADVEIEVFTLAASDWSFAIDTLCDPVPALECRAPVLAGKSKLQVKRGSTPARNAIAWAWTKGADTPLAALGTPGTDTDYALCVYDVSGEQPSRRLRLTVPAGPQWRPAGATGFQYADSTASSDGVQKAAVKSGGAGQAKATVKAKGAAVPEWPLPVASDARLAVQLRNANGECWGATFSTPKQNDDRAYKATSE